MVNRGVRFRTSLLKGEKGKMTLRITSNGIEIGRLEYVRFKDSAEIVNLVGQKTSIKLKALFKSRYGVFPTEYLFGSLIKRGVRYFNTGQLTSDSQRLTSRMVARGLILHHLESTPTLLHPTRSRHGIELTDKFHATAKRLRLMKVHR